MGVTRQQLLDTLGELLFGLARQRRPLVLRHGRDWRVERIGRRTVYHAPDGGAYIPCEPAAEPDIVIDWPKQRMVLPMLKLRRFDAEKAKRKEQRKQQQFERRIDAGRKRRAS